MNLLCIDTSGPFCGVALTENGALRYECALDARLTHSQTLMTLVDQAFDACGLRPSDIDLYAVVAGPGSFTGVRIGVATVKGLAFAHDAPCVAVNALEALALNGRFYPGWVCPILDARAGQVYAAAFRVGGGAREMTRLLDDDALKLEAFIERARERTDRALFVGDGVAAHRARIAELWPQAEFGSPAGVSLRAGLAAEIALESAPEARISHRDLRPIYLRAPQAVREKQAREENARA